ncbi:MAG: YidC/Oxa1 family membrane protein insertase [Clostridia bacterium]|jgi:membrane protein insertase, YidC/Oxa1 family, C-terminal domain|nr:YidC/Oxa1 family membrane protein insertase [Clostridia bacterium]MCR4683298.1 YidC/Oxa1 family membrane protein insertase [Clostridiales bacterium]
MIDTILCWIGQFLGWLDKLTGNYMLALFIFAFIVELLMIPFGIKQQKNQIKQASLRPKEMAIRNKYKGRDDKVTQQKVSEEIQAMYKEENYSPFSGCLPMLLQLPVIIALYQVVIDPLHYVLGVAKDAITAMTSYISAMIEAGTFDESFASTRGSIALINKIQENGIEFFKGVIEWADGTDTVTMAGQDVYNAFTAVADRLPNFKALGLNLAEIPSIKNPSWLWVIPVLTFLAYFGSMKLTRLMTYQPTSGDAATDKATGCSNTIMDVMMPLFSVYITFIVPAAIGVYWIFKSLIGTLKSFIFHKLMPYPKFTEEDYKAAERELAGKTPKEKARPKADIDSLAENPNSLFRQDAEDYVSPEEEAEIARKLGAADGDEDADKGKDSSLISQAPLKK